MTALSHLDWSLVQAFLSVAETGSLSAAARDLGASQPTLGRQIKALETSLSAELFRRKPRGLELTDTGAALLAPARAMRDAMHQISLTAAGTSVRLEGTVRITASEATSAHHLPAIVARIRAAEPDIAIEVAPSDTASNLLYREADIAIRMFRPTQLDLVTRHIGDIELGIYAAHSYLENRPPLTRIEDFAAHDFVGYDQDTAIVDGMNALGLPVTRDFFKTRCDDNITNWELVRAGCGVGFGQRIIGDADPLLRHIDLGIPIPPLPVWLTAHEAMRQTPRIRRVWDMLAAGLEDLLSS